MKQVYKGTTLINDVYIGSTRMSNIVVPPKPLEVDFIIIAGGGGGGAGQAVLLENNPGGAGGGAGGVITGSYFVNYGVPYTGSVGAGGNRGEKTSNGPGGNGGNTTFFNLTALGGGGGGAGEAGSNPDCTNYYGRNGGSGGGAGNHYVYDNNCDTGSALQPTSSWGGFGHNGGQALGPNFSGAGGGAGGPASYNNPGPGITWLDGQSYASGGLQGASIVVTVSGSGGSGGVYDDSGDKGGNGLIAIRYDGGVKGTGGNIVTDGTQTFHYFNTGTTPTFVYTIQEIE